MNIGKQVSVPKSKEDLLFRNKEADRHKMILIMIGIMK